ncbi:dihydrodipicolinate synthase family protein [Microbaculum marinum]|uniref:Dihydrodipicolinate synthase family protein n=1 Tax=Microbaculum marinum TaxID=1764581 RepID=A0AAW9RS88_9HYPH
MPKLIVPAATPIDGDRNIDIDRLAAHCHALLADGADAIALFGTTGEATSYTSAERIATLEGLIAAGIPAEIIMPGTGCPAVPDTIALSRHAFEQGCRTVMTLPPYYYKAVSADGIRDSMAWLIDALSGLEPRIILYHIPPVAQVGFPVALVRRLADEFKGIVVGVKDSSGDWSNTEALLEACPDLDIFPGSETWLLPGLRKGGAGCITATGNLNARAIRAVIDETDPARADARHEEIVAYRKTVEARPAIPAIKAVLADRYGIASWGAVRPPLRQLPVSEIAPLLDDLSRLSAEPVAG